MLCCGVRSQTIDSPQHEARRKNKFDAIHAPNISILEYLERSVTTYRISCPGTIDNSYRISQYAECSQTAFVLCLICESNA